MPDVGVIVREFRWPMVWPLFKEPCISVFRRSSMAVLLSLKLREGGLGPPGRSIELADNRGDLVPKAGRLELPDRARPSRPRLALMSSLTAPAL